MKNVVARLAMIGVGGALCFGVTACGKETVITAPEATTEAAVASAAGEAETGTAEETVAEELIRNWKLVQFTVKGETTKASELTNYDRENMAPRFKCEDGIHVVFSNAMKDHPGTVSPENGKYLVQYDDSTKNMFVTVSGDRLTLENETGTLEIIFEAGGEESGQAEAPVPLVEQWDDSIVERYAATYVISEDETLEMLRGVGKNNAYFSGTDYAFDVIMDLKDDGTAVIYYDFEGWMQILKNNLDEKFNDLMIAEYAEDGVSREELEKKMTDMGFQDLDQAMEAMKASFMEELDPALRKQLEGITDIRIDMTWSKDGDTLYLDKGDGIRIGEDGTFDYRLPKAQSITGKEYDLHFVPVTR